MQSTQFWRGIVLPSYDKDANQAARRAVIYRHIRVVGRLALLVIVQREQPTVFLCIGAPRGECPDLAYSGVYAGGPDPAAI
jgi:hypothetical protein